MPLWGALLELVSQGAYMCSLQVLSFCGYLRFACTAVRGTAKGLSGNYGALKKGFRSSFWLEGVEMPVLGNKEEVQMASHKS